jgi:serine/threonine-protein phosphatase 6 regulatory ankyrin repeat subunit B
MSSLNCAIDSLTVGHHSPCTEPAYTLHCPTRLDDISEAIEYKPEGEAEDKNPRNDAEKAPEQDEEKHAKDEENDDDDACSCASWDQVSQADEDIIVVNPIDYKTYFSAADHGDVAKLTELLDAGANVEEETMRGWTALIMAIMKGHIEIVKLLLNRGADINHRSCSLPPLVHAIAKEANLEIMKLLLDHGANPLFVSGKEQKNALHWAASEGALGAIEILLDRGMDIEAKSRRGCTPLILAADVGQARAAELLLKRGANPLVRSENGGTPLIWAACHNHLDAIKLFLDADPNMDAVDNFGHSAVFLAAYFGSLEVLDFLLEHGADITARPKERPILQVAAAEGHAKVVQRLIDHGCDVPYVNHRQMDALGIAIRERHVEVIQVLLKHLDGDEDPKESVALQFALADGHAMVKSLAATTSLCYSRMMFRRSDPGKHDWLTWVLLDGGSLVRPHAMNRILHYALEELDQGLIEALITHGCDLGIELESGSTPLCYAIRHGNVPIIKMVLESGVDVNAFHGGFATALDEAISSMKDGKDTAIVDLLLAHGASINRGKDPGHTAFSVVLLRDGPDWNELALKMLASVQDVNADRDSMGSTLLHVAVLRNRSDLISFLLDRGADLEAVDEFGVTPFLLGCQFADLMLPVLQKHGANMNALYHASAGALHAAAAQGNVSALTFLACQPGLDIEARTAKGYTPLACALTWAQEPAALYLLSRGAKVNLKTSKNATPLHFAAKYNLDDAMKDLLSRDADISAVDDQGWTPFHEACAMGSQACVSLLLAGGADIEAQVPNSDRPLHIALINEREEVALALMDAGADVTARASRGRTSLHIAAEYSLPEAAERLIDMGVDIEAQDEETWTALCSAGSIGVMRVLIGNGANVNYQDKDAWTPLQQAVNSGLVREARCLLRHGADMEIRTTDDGLTVLERVQDMKEGGDEATNRAELLDLLHVVRSQRISETETYRKTVAKETEKRVF